jgi:hypothetical protein
MAAYWLILLPPIILALSPVRATPAAQAAAWWGLGALLALLIGLRHEVGADWDSYLLIHSIANDGSAWDAIAGPDPAYALLNRLSASVGLGIYGVNLACAAIFVAGVMAFCRQQPMPWLALAVATPYLVIVVAMGYTRQSAALGLLLLGLIALVKGRSYRFLLFVMAATLFHKTALLLGLFAFLTGRRSAGFLAGMGIVLVIALGFFVLLEQYGLLWEAYVLEAMESEGGPIRVLMNVAAGCAMFAFWKPWRERFGSDEPWKYFAVLSLLSLCLVPFASTAVDRVALYFTPLQLVVWSRLPVLVKDGAVRALLVLFLLATYSAVLYVWLFMSAYTVAWIPYRNILF